MAHRCGLRPFHAFNELFAFGCEAFGKRLRHRCLDAVDYFLRRNLAASLFRQFRPILDKDAIADRLDAQLARLAARPVLGHEFPAPGESSIAKITVDYVVHQAQARCTFGVHRVAAGNQIERRHYAAEPRCTLRAAGTGQQAELDLGQSDLRIRNCASVMAAQREFESAPQRRAVHGGDNPLGRILDLVTEIRQMRFLRRLAEFPDVCAGDERPALAEDQHRLRGVRLRLAEAGLYAGPDSVR